MKFTLPLICCALLFSCSPEKAASDDQESVQEETTDTIPLLNDLLDARKKAWSANVDSAKKAAYEEGFRDLFETGITESALNVGKVAPDFELKNATNETVSLESYLKKGPVVLTWYRGGWCPYCNITLSRMQQELPKIKALGANLIALTPEIPDSSLSTKEKLDLEFEVLSDVGNDVARQYGLVYELLPKVAEYYENGFGLHAYNGNGTNELPLAATYVIDQNGTIRYAFVHIDYRRRAEPKDILNALERLKQEP